MKRAAAARRHYSLDDYFMVELESVTKHEFLGGEIHAMAGASLAHNHITSNVHVMLRTRLRGSGCSAFTSDLRIATPGGLYTYPDVSVTRGTVELVAGRPDTATNPVLLVEVLSDATRDYDRGEKFELYKRISTLTEYLTIEQGMLRAEHWQRGQRGGWKAALHARRNAVVRLRAGGVALAIAEIYRDALT